MPIPQRDAAWVAEQRRLRNHDEIVRAKDAGELADLLGAPRPLDPDQPLTHADVKRLWAEGRHTDIEAARLDGRLNALLGITPNPTQGA